MPGERHQRLLRNPWLVAGTGLGLLLGLLLLFGPLVTPHDPWDMSFAPLSPPSSEHWLGVNDSGMDILAELLTGLRNTLVFGLITGSAGLLLGVGVGLSAAWFGGLTGQALMRLADIVLAIPAVMILVLLAAFLRPSPLVLALVLAGLTWPTTAKGIRAQALVIKNRLHIKAAKRLGAPGRYIIVRHLLPELFPLYLIGFAAKARMAMFMEASLAFLGLFDPTRKSLGMMINYALDYYFLDIWVNWLLPPIVSLTLLIMTATFLAVGLEKTFDPRFKDLA